MSFVSRLLGAVTLFVLLGGALPAVGAASNDQPFRITVVDDETGRGVPLVELKTVNNLRFYTDSNGIVAFREPGLLGQKVYFSIFSHGYEYPKDGFGYRGVALQAQPGKSATIRLKRQNLAERLYRMTGEGIYRDSLLVGADVPLQNPVLNGQVLGSDSVMNIVYRNRIYWFWGDTNRPGYPLGNFNTPGAVSLLPDRGGLAPDRGVDLTYFLDKQGFAKAVAPMPGRGPTWIGGLTVLRDDSGTERLYCTYAKIKPPLEAYEWGLARFNDDTQQFDRIAGFPPNAHVHPTGHTFRHRDAGTDYFYFAVPYPLLRVPASAKALEQISAYETYTCLQPGSELKQPVIDRDAEGRARYAWKKNTPLVGPAEQTTLIRQGLLQPHEALLPLQDAKTGKPVHAHGGSVYWNEFRQRWGLISTELYGSSMLGEIWYAEADTPTGPWTYAVKVLTHEKYSFYNPKQHPMFDKDNGRVIYFEGTYTSSFSGNEVLTPRYDYNQIMYRLDLSRPNLALPVPVYSLPADIPCRLGTCLQVKDRSRLPEIAFYACDRAGTRTVPLYAVKKSGGEWKLSRQAPTAESRTSSDRPAVDSPLVLHVLPAEMENAPSTTVPLYEFRNPDTGGWTCSIDAGWKREGYVRADRPLCRVWRDPRRTPADARPSKLSSADH
jgi:hypothetical protein